MKQLSRSCLAIVAGAAILASAGPAGLAFADEAPDTAASAGQSSLQVSEKDTLLDSVTFHAGDGIRLGNMSTVHNDHTVSLKPIMDADGSGEGFESAVKNYADRDGNDSVVEVSWPILEDSGTQTGSTVSTRIVWGRASEFPTEASCKINVVDPVAPQHGRFRCKLQERGWDNDWDLFVTGDAVDRRAEASGTIKTTGSVSLHDGYRFTESSLRKDGAAVIPAQSSTQFDTVLRPVDHPQNEADTARMIFTYALFDNGEPVYSKKSGKQLLVAGNAANARGDVFKGSSSCNIVSAAGMEEDSGYTCQVQGDYVATGIVDGRVRYDATFTVGKK